MIRILVADDHPIVREGILRLISDNDDLRVVAEVADGALLLETLGQVMVDVVLLDISMPGPGCLELLASIRVEYPRVAVVILTAHQDRGYAVRALRAGAVGFLTKCCQPRELAEGIRTAAGGGTYVTQTVSEELVRVVVTGDRALHEALSDREFQVLRMMTAGESSKQIASQLGISPKTVSTYRTRIKEKLGVASPMQAVRYAIEEGILD